MKKRFSAAVLAMAALSACSGPGPAPSPDRAEVAAQVRQNVGAIVTAYNARDAESALAMNAPDTRVMSHGLPNVDRDENLAMIRQHVTDPALHLEIDNEELDVAEAGAMALYSATYEWQFSDPETGGVTTERGNWVMVFKRQADGSMKVYREIISDLPEGS